MKTATPLPLCRGTRAPGVAPEDCGFKPLSLDEIVRADSFNIIADVN